MKELIQAIDRLRDKLVAQCTETPDGADIVARSISASAGYGPYLVELSIELVEDDSPQGRTHAAKSKAAWESAERAQLALLERGGG